MGRVFLFGGDILKKYSIHLVATNRLSNIKDILEGIKEFEGQEVELSISKWNYSFLALNYSLTNEIVEEPDIMLIFDNAEYNRIDGATGKNIGYKKILDVLRVVKVNLQKSRIVLVLSEDKKEDKSFISEIMKMDLQNFFFSDSEEYDSSLLKSWLFGPEKTLDDNKILLSVDEAETFQPIVKFVDRVIEKPVTQTEIVEKIVKVEKIMKEGIGATTIAVGGTKAGAGTTNLAIEIAKYLRTINKKIALVELNNKPVLKGLKISGIDIYSQDCIDYVMDKPVNLLNEMDIDEYNYIIIDLGSLYHFKSGNSCEYNERTAEKTEYFYEMNRSHISVLVHPSGEWNLKYFTPFLINNDISSKWKLALTHTDTIDKRIREKFKNYYAAPYMLNIAHEDTISFMQDMLKEIATVRKPKRNLLEKLDISKNINNIKNMIKRESD